MIFKCSFQLKPCCDSITVTDSNIKILRTIFSADVGKKSPLQMYWKICRNGSPFGLLVLLATYFPPLEESGFTSVHNLPLGDEGALSLSVPQSVPTSYWCTHCWESNSWSHACTTEMWSLHCHPGILQCHSTHQSAATHDTPWLLCPMWERGGALWGDFQQCHARFDCCSFLCKVSDLWFLFKLPPSLFDK